MTTPVPRHPRTARADHAYGRRATVRAWAVGGVILVMLGACTQATGNNAPSADRGVDGGRPSEMTASGTGLIPPDTDLTGVSPSTEGSSEPDRQAGPPDAALLTWLSGPEPQDGVVLGPAGQRQWFGRAAGEHATLGDGWYRYFGADGSLVGCTSGGACVGVGSDGTVAVSAAPDGLRQVYAADGSYLGSYNHDGESVGKLSDPPGFAAAIAATKVDMATLVGEATRAAPFAGGITGDPHVITMGGQRYTTQLGGQYIARAGDDEHQIQVEFTPMEHRPDVSIASAVALATGSHRIVVTDDGIVSRDGETLSPVGSFAQEALPGGAALGRWPASESSPATVVVVWPDGSSVTVAARRVLGLTAIARIAPTLGANGIFGAAAVTQGPDLTVRGATSAAPGGVSEAAIESWTVPASARLLPATSVSDSGPTVQATTPPVAIDPGAQKAASKLCDGLARSQDIAACSFDVALTGDTGFIAGHLDLARAADTPPVPSAFARRWPALVAGPTAGAAALPASGRIDVTLKPGAGMLYQLRTTGAGAVNLAGLPPCGAAATSSVGMDQPAWRLFDRWRRPVSDRLPLCAAASTASVPSGQYLLAVGNALGADPLDLAATVVGPGL